MKDFEIEYDDEAGTLRVVFGEADNEMELCTCTVENFNVTFSGNVGGLRAEMLPTAIRMIIDNPGSDKVIIMEEKPGYHRVNFTPAKLAAISDVNSTSKESFYLPFPWLIHVIKLDKNYQVIDIWTSCSSKPLDEARWREPLVPVPIHNYYENGRLCRPVYADAMASETSPTVLGITTKVYHELWSSGFNSDLYDAVNNYFNWAVNDNWKASLLKGTTAAKMKKIKDTSFEDYCRAFYKAWEQLSLDDVMGLRWDWTNHDIKHFAIVEAQVGGVVDYNEMRVKILTAAQNAAMM